ncbi:DUF2017 domain-containing protein [Spelaeicoccus albus]|uniref:DUF2017 domain-containing protein n=1 Tax=Spelaeicoccus albus TaxID=1280376 RepID=A0A7Z0D5E4_9MICO|nr:DUF2017 domain-containing protein [Spelaeicoccus albus]NYI69225.1 hypothetical protein [Spelaeicoccus albus]
MAKAFRRTSRGIIVNLAKGERTILTTIFTDTIALLEPTVAENEDPLAAMVGITESAGTPSDPALARLLPPGSTTDDEDADEFRRYTERGLRERKIAGLQTALLTVGRSDPIALADAEAEAWLVALTDVRLVLAERLGVKTEEDFERLEAETDEDGGEGHQDMLIDVYDFLTWLQETLANALMGDLPEGDEE